jgi:hypothetical protein
MKLEVDKPEVTDLVVVYSGRFQPFHAGHYVSYLKLCQKFGKENVYIATSNSTSGPKSPFDFKEKKEIATKMFNVPSDKFIQVSNPYAPKEILSSFDNKTTAYIAAVGEKDASRLSGKYFKPYKGKTGYGYGEIGYTYAVPAESSPISGTDVRNWLGSGDDESKKKGFLKAYPKFNADIFKMITNKLNEDGFPGGIGTGLNLPGGYINGAPTGSANESNNTEPSSALRPEPKPTRHQIEHLSEEPNWHKNETLYDPIGHIMDRVLSEEMFKEFVDSYFTEAPNPIMDKEFDYTASDGTKKKITVKGALRLAKDHPAHVQASKMVGSDKPNAMAKGPTDAPVNQPKKLSEPGKAATQSAKPAQPGQPVKQGQTQQGKADKANPASSTPQGAEQTPPAQTLSGAELKSSAEKTPEEKSQEKKAEKYGSFKEFFKSESESIKKQAQALWKDFSTEEHHAADEMNNPESETRKGFIDRAAKFMTEFPENMVKGAYEVAKHKYHQLKNTTKAAKSLAISLSHGKGFQFGYEKDKNGKWGVNKKEAEKQKSAAKATAWDAAKIAGAVLTGGAISGVVGHIVGGGAAGGIASAALHGAGDTVSHGAGAFAHHMAVDFGKHCGFEALGLGVGIELEQAQKLAGKAGLTSVGVLPHMDKLFNNAMSYLSEDATPEDESKQHSDLLMNLVATILEKMKDFKPSSQQMFETMKSYSEVKKETEEKQKGLEASKLLKPIQEQISPLKRENVTHFVEYATKRLKLKEQPKVTLVEDPEFSRQNHSLGGYNVDSKEIFVATEGRLTADILRTIAHEMVHRKQDEMGLIGDSVKDGETGSTVENKANSIAAILLREYGKLNKTIYNEDINIDVDKGDTVLMGKFKNKKVVAKDFGTDDHGMPTINGKVATTFRIPRGEKAKPNPQSVFDEVGSNDWHFKAIMKLWDKANSYGKKKIGVAVCNDPNASKRDIEVQLRDTDYEEVTDMTDKLGLKEYIEKKKLSNAVSDFTNGHDDDNIGQSAELDTYDFDDKRKKQPGYQSDTEDDEEFGYEPVKTEKLTQSNLDSVERYADRELDPADIEFSNHFFDRVNDTRNGKEISEPELTGFFKRLGRHKKQFIDFLDKYNQIVVKDDRSNINIPFIKMANKVIAKTVMRKGDFQTNSPTIVNEITQGLYAGNLKINGKPVEIEVELLGADNKTKEFLTKVIHIDKEYQNKFPIGSTFRIPSRIFRLPGGGWHKIKSSAFNEETASEIIKDLDKVRHDLIKKVDVLIAKKKKLYSNVDIESPMSADEKQLDKDIQSIFSQIQQIILKKRTLKEAIVGDTIVCDNCSWTWKISDGGTDVYTCHKCGHDNQPKLNEAVKWEDNTFHHCMRGELPLSINIVQKLVEPIKTTTLHMTDVENLAKVAALEGTKKSISTFNKVAKGSKVTKGKGMWTEGGVIVSLSGIVLAQSIMDLWTKPDKQGRRWVNPGTVIHDLGRETDAVFNFAPHLQPFKKTYMDWMRMEDGVNEFTPDEKNKFIRLYFEAAEKFMLSKKKQFQDQYLNSNALYYDVDWNEVVLTQIKIEKILVIPSVLKTKTKVGAWEWDTKDEADKQKEIDKIKQKYKNVEVAKNEADIQNFINNNGGQVMNESVNKSVISEGGAYGHMSHPFDDMNLTFGDLKNIITGALTGKLELTREKTDGQALAISWKNGRLIAARNKGNLANAGANAMGIEDVASKFAGRGGLTDAYNFAMKDLSAAISSLSEPQRKKIFDEGKCFMNLEVIWPTSVNVIPYGQPLLVFHNTTCYDEKGVAVGANQGAATMLAGMIKQVNGDVQSKYTIQGPPVTRLPNNEELGSKQTKYLTQLQKLQFQFQLSNRDGVAEYHQAWWADFIDKSKVKLQKLEKDALINRWAFGDKSFRLNTITDKDAQKWAIDNDKVNVAKQQKDNIRPFEEIFLGVGADVLSFMDSVLTANPNAAVASMKQRLKDTADKVRGSGDITKIQKLKQELARLQSIGGLDKIVPNEGIVFIYKGNTYKLTGTFAPLNQILGIFYE